MITAEWLRAQGACEDQIRLFEATFPAGTAGLDDAERARAAGLSLEWLALNSSAPPAALGRLASDASAGVRWCVAANPSAPPSALERLASDADARVRRYVAGNPSTPPPALGRLASDANVDVRGCVAGNPSAPRL